MKLFSKVSEPNNKPRTLPGLCWF